MDSRIDVLRAELEDTENLVEVMISALEPLLWPRFYFSPYRDEQVRMSRTKFIPTIKKSFEPDSLGFITKAVDASDNKIVGFSLFTRKDEASVREEHTVKSEGESVRASAETHAEIFAEVYARESKAQYLRIMGKRPHVVLNSFYVLPKYQGQGIASRLIRLPLQVYSLHKLPIFVQSTNSARVIYEHFGFEYKASTVLDLSRWTGENAGFGLWSAHFLVREPGPILKPAKPRVHGTESTESWVPAI